MQQSKYCLTKRQLEVVECILAGMLSKEIARKLCISRRTVDRHREDIHALTGTKNSVQLIEWYENSAYGGRKRNHE